jgi:dihydroflavonol-4-reductase
MAESTVESGQPARGLACVTGADGLLGANLVRTLLAAGHSVRALVLPSSPAQVLDGLPIEVVRGDLLTADLNRLLDGCAHVFHCAAITDMRAPAELTFKVNVEGTLRLVAAALRAGVRRFVHTASASAHAFGSIAHPGNEESPFPAVYRDVPYMASKAEATLRVREAIAHDGLDAVFVAPTFMIGGLDARPSSGQLIVEFLRRRMRLVPPGGRNFAYVGDVAAGMLAALERGRSGEIYICGGENLTYRQFFTAVARAAGVAAPIGTLPRAAVLAAGAAGSFYQTLTGRPALVDRRMARLGSQGAWYTSTKAIRELDLPQTPIAGAINEALAWLRRAGHLTETGA